MSEIALFEQKEIRRVWQNEEWYFSVLDVVKALTDSTDPKQYIKKMRARDPELSNNWGTICTPVQMIAADGKQRKEQAANSEGLLRNIQSNPSPKAEPFKRRLAAIGAERIREIADPEIAALRAQDLYRKKGYPDDWIALRARGVATRAELTNEWKNRGIEKSSDYAILTAEISKAAFGMTPAEYKRLKGLKSENLRDHMSTLELLFTELSEAATTEIARNDDAQGMAENADAARRGGKIAGDARENLERQTGRSVSTSDNYKHLSSRTRKKLPEEES